MRIRQASQKDKEAVTNLIKMYPEKLLQAHLPKISNFFVVVEKGRLEIYSKRLAEIRSLAVAKKSQGKGIASQLIRYCLGLARKKKVYEVLAITGATGLFEKQGFNIFNKEKFALLKGLKN